MELQPAQKRVWAEINLDAAEHNYLEVRKRLKPFTKLCCVVKANGYGHGAIELSKTYEALGAEYLAVSNIEEALLIRHSGVVTPILVLGYTDPRCASELAHNNITQCVFSYEYGLALSKNAAISKVKVKIHVKIDTGMGRIGFQCFPGSLDAAAKICKLPEMIPEGIFTHFASADEGCEGKAYTLNQFEKFIKAIAYLKKQGRTFAIRHCANSAGIFDYPETQLDMVRAGVVLYGLQPSTLLTHPGNLIPILELKTIIDCVKTIQAGDCVSYGCEFKANHDMKIATIPLGYADGFWRSNHRNGGTVKIKGHSAPIIGRICMDQCMIDVSDIAEVVPNDEVVVYGVSGDTSIDRVAKSNSTINYEVVCAISGRVPRVYKRNGVIIAIEDSAL